MKARKSGLWESVYYAIVQSKTLTVRTVTYLPHERAHIDRILGAFLDAVGMTSLRNNLSYCVHELAGNAKKANTKRVYFQEKNLDINDANDYAAGMSDFRNQTVDHIEHYLECVKEAGLYIKFQFRKVKRGVRVTVRNNSPLTAIEEKRIDEKLAIAQHYGCLAEAYAKTEDGAEGAGLGIVMMLFMLKNLGFGPEAFSIRVVGGETVATLSLSERKAANTSEATSGATA